MQVGDISNTDALGLFVFLLAVVALIARAVPAEQTTEPVRHFSDAEVTAHDPQLPKYALASLLALALAAAHASIKSLPPIYDWLEAGGYGGHLVRDIANTHLMIVVGGTIGITGLTWYTLPRVLRRPLWSDRVATASYWCTLVGAVGFYLTNVVAGLILAGMAHARVADPSLGVGRALPLGVSATVMGIGYWTFVLEVAMTVRAGRSVRDPDAQPHLGKFFLVGALGLFVGTVQGVLQVMPDAEDWIHRAGGAGEYIDPIAHAHVNLVTGALVLLTGSALFWSRARPTRREYRIEEIAFWILVPGSVALYLTFMTLGLVEGGRVVDDGLSFVQAIDSMGLRHPLPLAVAGTVTLTGLWLMLGILAARYGVRDQQRRPSSLLIVTGCALLFLGTAQGLVQLTPPAKAWLESAGEYGDAVANAHAQLNMLGGTVLLLLGLLLRQAYVLLGADLERTIGIRAWRRVALGALTYYIAAMATAIGQGEALRTLRPASAGDIAVLGPLGMSAGMAIYAWGIVLLAAPAWRATTAYRRRGLHAVAQALGRSNDSGERWRQRIPMHQLLLAELVTGLAGFPGIGWIMSGRAVIGLPLATLSAAVVWGVLPLLMSPFGDSPLRDHGLGLLLIYLGGTTAFSVGALWWRLRVAMAGRSPRRTFESDGVAITR